MFGLPLVLFGPLFLDSFLGSFLVEKALMMLLVGFSKIMTHSSRVPAKKIAIILLAFNVLLSTFWLVLVIIDPKS